jgi:hypothetical protein
LSGELSGGYVSSGEFSGGGIIGGEDNQGEMCITPRELPGGKSPQGELSGWNYCSGELSFWGGIVWGRCRPEQLSSGELSWGIIGRMGEILGGVVSQRKRTGVGEGANIHQARGIGAQVSFPSTSSNKTLIHSLSSPACPNRILAVPQTVKELVDLGYNGNNTWPQSGGKRGSGALY